MGQDQLTRARSDATLEIKGLMERLKKAEARRDSTKKVRALEGELAQARTELSTVHARITELEGQLANTGIARATKARMEKADHFASKIRTIIDDLPASVRSSPKAIAHELNQRGIRSARGGLWEGSQISALLKRIAGG